MLHRPARLGGREVRVKHQARHLAHLVLVTRLAQPAALLGGAPVLPHDGAGTRLQRPAVPHDERLALVRDADRAHIARLRAGGVQRLRGRVLDDAPDLVCVVLHPSRLREML